MYDKFMNKNYVANYFLKEGSHKIRQYKCPNLKKFRYFILYILKYKLKITWLGIILLCFRLYFSQKKLNTNS